MKDTRQDSFSFLPLTRFSALFLLFSISILGGGTLDPAFGTGGKVSFRYGETSDQAINAILQPDGKIVIVGATIPTGQSPGFRDFAVARLNADGSFDNTFGGNGRVVTAFGSFQEDYAGAVVLQADGKIVVGGATSGRFALARYNGDGSLDDTFGSGGRVVTDIPDSVNEAIGYLYLLPDGKFLAGGGTIASSGSPEGQAQIAFVRYNSDGSIDTSFGTGGTFKIYFGNLITYLDGVAMQPDGKLLVAGSYAFTRPNCVPSKTVSCGDGLEFLLRYNPNMTLDKKFGRRNGKELGRTKSYGLTLQSDGSILGGGFPLVHRYTANGRLDTTFDEAVFPNQPPGQFITNGPRSLTQRANGTIVACKHLRAQGHDDIGIVLYGSDGRALAYDQRDFFGADDGCVKILLQPDGKFLVIARAQLEQQGNYSIGLMRFLDITP